MKTQSELTKSEIAKVKKMLKEDTEKPSLRTIQRTYLRAYLEDLEK